MCEILKEHHVFYYRVLRGGTELPAAKNQVNEHSFEDFTPNALNTVITELQTNYNTGSDVVPAILLKKVVNNHWETRAFSTSLKVGNVHMSILQRRRRYKV